MNSVDAIDSKDSSADSIDSADSVDSIDSSMLTLRPAREEDDEFLLRVYACTREEEVALTGWSPEQIDAFVRMQFIAQRAHYTQHYPEQQLEVVLLDGVPIGRLWIARRSAEIRILDITILPDQRNRGFGTALLADLKKEATSARKPLTIYVESYNPSLRLFERLGFKKSGESGPSYLLELAPET